MAKVYVPRPEQQAMFDFALGQEGVLLGAEPGSGKTVVSLTLADHLLHHDFESGIEKVLISGPRIVAEEVWAREVQEWAHLNHLKIRVITSADFDYYTHVEWHCVDEDGQLKVIVESEATEADREYLAKARESGVALRKQSLRPRTVSDVRKLILGLPERFVAISRDHITALAKALRSKWPFQLVILDESTSYANPKSQRSIAVRAMRHHGRIKRVVLLSGTFMPRSAEQLWAQMLVVDNGKRLGHSRALTKFRDRFMEPASRNKERIFNYKLRADKREALFEAVSDVVMSVKADSWRQTDPARIVRRKVALPVEARAVYDQMEEEHLVLLDEEVVAVNAAVVSSKLLQIASGTVKGESGRGNTVHTVKLDYLQALIEEIDGPVVIVYWWANSLPRLKERFHKKGRSIKEEGALQGFIDGKFDLLYVHPQSAGHGVNGLQWRTHRMVILDPFHSLELMQQVIARLDRSGQERQVVVDLIEADDTVDETILPLWEERAVDQDAASTALLWRRKKLLERRTTGG